MAYLAYYGTKYQLIYMFNISLNYPYIVSAYWSTSTAYFEKHIRRFIKNWYYNMVASALILRQNECDITNSVMRCSMRISKGATTDFMESKNNVSSVKQWREGKGK